MSRTRNGRNVFLWDLDDTLMWTSYAYSKAFQEFYDYLCELFGNRLIEIRTLGTVSEGIDKQLIKETNPVTGNPYGYSMDRFPESLVRTYRRLCESSFGIFDELVAENIRDIGRQAFSALHYKRQGLVEGVEEVLDFMVQREDKLILFTKGERMVQETKIRTLRLERWFGEDVFNGITSIKSAEIFRVFKRQYPRKQVWSVGNSLKSDVVPALEAGIGAIYIPYLTWLGEEHTESLGDDDAIELKHVIEILDLYKQGVL